MTVPTLKPIAVMILWLLAVWPSLPYAQAVDNAGVNGGLSNSRFMLLDINGAIGPATHDYIERSLDKAAEQGYSGVILRIDTPGGLDTSMRAIIKKILASTIPVIAYVAPGGARAASAGTYILYAAHVAAMAPGTNLGAATPVQIIGPGTFGGDDEERDKKGEQNKAKPVVKDPMQHKMVNDAVAYLQSLAKLRGRNTAWAERAVREAASLPAEEALRLHVIDLIAANQAELMQKLNGRTVDLPTGPVTLHTEHAEINVVKPDWRSELLAVITNPNIAYILMLIGLYGLIFEFSNPGTVVPGTVGGICLLLALYAFQVLPVNYAGMALIILGIALMTAEAFVPSFGILGVGGVIAFVIGSVILMDTDVPGFGINLGLIGGFALSSLVFLALALGLLLKSRRKPVVCGKEGLIGDYGEVLEDFSGSGMIRIHSENWRARSERPLRKNEKVRVTGLQGLTLLVSPVKDEEKD